MRYPNFSTVCGGNSGEPPNSLSVSLDRSFGQIFVGQVNDAAGANI